jgi:hypothetical protein
VAVGGISVGVGGIGVEAGAHPFTIIARSTNARKIDRSDFFMALSPFALLRKFAYNYDLDGQFRLTAYEWQFLSKRPSQLGRQVVRDKKSE